MRRVVNVVKGKKGFQRGILKPASPTTVLPRPKTSLLTDPTATSDDSLSRALRLSERAKLESAIDQAISEHSPYLEKNDRGWQARCTGCAFSSLQPSKSKATEEIESHKERVAEVLTPSRNSAQLANAQTALNWEVARRDEYIWHKARMIPEMPTHMSAREILNAYDPKYADLGTNESLRQFWRRKRREAKEWGYYDSIAKEGVTTPILVLYEETPYGDLKPIILEGHHRVAVMAKENPDKPIPILYGSVGLLD